MDYFINKNNLEKYVIDYAKNDYRTIDLINDIKDNKTIILNNKKITLKNALIKADLVTLSMGINDFLSYITLKDISKNEAYNYVDEVMKDIDVLLSLMREYCKEDIIYIGFYNYFKLNDIDFIIKYSNERLKELCNKYKVTYLETYKDFDQNSKYLPNPLDIHPNREGYVKIGEKIITAFFD
jgi:lysophospholipase L1-like esterase